MSTAYSGPYPSRESVTRERIMDACVLGIAEHGLGGLKQKHIIEAAGISKQTLYNHYRNREEIILDAFTREGTRISRACAEEIAGYTDLEEKFVKGFLYIYANLPRNPLLNLMVLDHQSFLESIGVREFPLARFGWLCFGAVLNEYPSLVDEFDEIAELWSRAVLSLLLFEGEQARTPEQLEGFVRRRLLPGLNLGQHLHADQAG